MYLVLRQINFTQIIKKQACEATKSLFKININKSIELRMQINLNKETYSSFNLPKRISKIFASVMSSNVNI